MKNALALIFVFFSVIVFAQPGQNFTKPQTPIWTSGTKAAGDSCGVYFNNYVGLQKTSSVLPELMQTGDVVEDYHYGGRAQRFTTNQPIEISGVEFYAYENSSLDSVMVITSLHAYTSANDSLGPELIRDTVYVKHTAFTVVLPNISVKSYFDTPITMTGDYVIAMHTTLNEELYIITNDYTSNDGNGEFNSYALYNNPVYPSDLGWYPAITYFAADYDYLMNPLVKYDLFQPFNILNDSICPGAVNAGCVTYSQVGNFSNHMYNSQFSSPATHMRWLWGDGYQNVDLLSACHTYATANTYAINLRDTLFRFDFASPHCIVDVTQPIVVLGPPVADFSFIQDGLTVDFTSNASNNDSVWWDFGDATAGTNTTNPTHNYTTVGSFDVWFYAYNDCHVDSTSLTVTTDDVGIKNDNLSFEIYPNPANDLVYIKGALDNSKIEVLNLLGQVVYSTTTSNQLTTLSMSNFSSGTYFIRITQDGNSLTQKLIVKH